MQAPRIQLPDGTERVPGKIICVGRNYLRHVQEMNSDVPTEPVLFLKPTTALVSHGGSVVIPPETSDVHHEIELVAVIGRACRRVSPSTALDHVAAYAVGIDMTARDVQSRAKKKGLPWSVAKGFDSFAPLGPLVPSSTVDPAALDLVLTVNGTVRQHGSTARMIFTLPHLIAYCSSVFTLLPGDLLFTGTPEGVGPVKAGDEMVARASGLPELRVNVISM